MEDKAKKVMRSALKDVEELNKELKYDIKSIDKIMMAIALFNERMKEPNPSER